MIEVRPIEVERGIMKARVAAMWDEPSGAAVVVSVVVRRAGAEYEHTGRVRYRDLADSETLVPRAALLRVVEDALDAVTLGQARRVA